MSHKVDLDRVCPFCGVHTIVTVNAADLDRYLDRALDLSVQQAFPGLDANAREAINTGICPTCWDKTMFDGPDEPLEDIE